jgi:hypothetical protein
MGSEFTPPSTSRSNSPDISKILGLCTSTQDLQIGNLKLFECSQYTWGSLNRHDIECIGSRAIFQICVALQPQ